MTTLLIIVHVLVSLFLIVIVLLQHGKGADIGATFGGSGQSVFGSEGPVPLLNKITTFSAIVFMGTSISLAYLSANESTGSIMNDLPVQETTAPVQQEAPVTIPMPEADIQPVEQVEEPAGEATSAVQEVAPDQEAEPTEAEVTTPAAIENEPLADATQESDIAPAAEESAEQASPVEQVVEPETAPEQAE
ncbi:MAG: preprotein translocase subunit SecG [Candidatus Electrothrix aestuarii]|uniref:Protein-export membrane protein SecG n=1 Tax=Candidatus Electrothrix aestuarii TaxID=3062594 RepID=A0AAU8M0V4_9BACT|nr:preprotein translocase subunit SecG [Candidatus Electrothrix aestuarii]